MFSKRQAYLKAFRLSDVIRLLSVLSIEENYTFRRLEGLNKTLNGPPKSAKNWFDLAKDHPEFFKFGVDGDSISLLIRYLNKIKENDKDKFPALTIDQTQKLIDQAIALHDKQIARFQKNSFLIPILTAVIASLTTAIVTYYTLSSSNNQTKQIDKKVDKILHLIEASK